jgi:FkbM family methyltransferase
MISVGGQPFGGEGDVQFHGLFYPDGDKITRHMAERLEKEPFYQHDKFHQAMSAVPKDRRRIAVDCGAWVGGWSVNLAKNFFRVVAIEASPDNARCVAKNTEPCGNVMVLNLAVGDTNELFHTYRKASGGVSSQVSQSLRQDDWLPMRRLDDIHEIRELPHLDYLKIHVNGMELKALRGAETTIRKHKPVMTVVLKRAIEDFGDTPEAARDFLGKLGYRPDGGERPYEIWVPN